MKHVHKMNNVYELREEREKKKNEKYGAWKHDPIISFPLLQKQNKKETVFFLNVFIYFILKLQLSLLMCLNLPILFFVYFSSCLMFFVRLSICFFRQCACIVVIAILTLLLLLLF